MLFQHNLTVKRKFLSVAEGSFAALFLFSTGFSIKHSHQAQKVLTLRLHK